MSSNFVNILASNCFVDASGAPRSGTLRVIPSSNFGTGTQQAVGDAIIRPIQNGSMVGELKLFNPAFTSPQGVGYTFQVTDSSYETVTFANVLIVPDTNGNFDLGVLQTGQFVTGVPQTVISIGGASAAPDALTLTAGNTSVSAYTAVAVANGLAVTASSGNVAQLGAVVGIATQGAQPNASLQVQYNGQLEYNGWAWASGEPIFLGSNGALTQTAPTSGFFQVLGVAVTSTAILIALQPPISF